MPVAISVADLARAIRVGSSTAETAEVMRLLTFATTTIERHLGSAYGTAPDAVLDEAVIRLAGYLYDKPTSSRGASFAGALRNSGAAEALLAWREHRGGATGGAASSSTSSGTTGGPGGPGVDQVARDAAAAAQRTADANTAAIDHEDSGLAAVFRRLDNPAGGIEPRLEAVEGRTAANARAIPAKASNDDVDGESDDADYVTVAKTFRAIARKVKSASTTVAGIVTIARNADVDATETDTTRVPDVAKAKRLIERLVPAWARDSTTAIPVGAKLANVPVLHVSAADTFHGSPNAISLRNVPETAAGRRYGFFAELANTDVLRVGIGSVTRPLERSDGTPTESGDIVVGQFVELIDTGTKFRAINITPQASAFNPVGALRSSWFPGTADSPSPTIQAKDIGRNQVPGDKIPSNAIERGHLQDEAVGEPELTAAVRTKLNARASGTVDQTARDGVADNAAAIAAIPHPGLRVSPDFIARDSTGDLTFVVHLPELPSDATQVVIELSGFVQRAAVVDGQEVYAYTLASADADNLRTNRTVGDTLPLIVSFVGSTRTFRTLVRVLASAEAAPGDLVARIAALEAAAGGDPVLLATLANTAGTSTRGTDADFNAVRGAINGSTYKAVRIEATYPRTFATITDGEGYAQAEWRIPAGLQVPSPGGRDVWFREFGAAASDQSGVAEPLSFSVRPGTTSGRRLTVDHRLPNGSTIRIYGVP